MTDITAPVKNARVITAHVLLANTNMHHHDKSRRRVHTFVWDKLRKCGAVDDRCKSLGVQENFFTILLWNSAAFNFFLICVMFS